MDPLWLFLVFFRASVFSVGGQSGLPLLRDDLVRTGVLTDVQLIEALTIGRLSTGPGGLYMVAIGFVAGGWLGAAMALVALALPPLLVLPASAYLRPRLAHRRVNGLIRGLALTTTGLVVAVSVELLWAATPNGNPAIWQFALVVLGVAVSIEGKRHPVIVIAAGAAVGLLLAAQ
ncbi:MAG TPA: chromate transporter [Candidatus Limnocylindria bacterium]|nr:chromate transporter [Candidatus Limnocylindria bacterium]